MTNWKTPRGSTLLYGAIAVFGSLAATTLTRLSIASSSGRRTAARALPEGPIIVVSNHTSLADGVLLALTCRRLGRSLRLLATGGLFSVPVLGWVLRRVGFVPVHRGTDRAADALADAVAALAAGEAIGLYPEGGITRRDDRRPGRGKTGAIRLALASGAPIVPVAMVGTHRVVGRKRVAIGLLRALILRPRVDVAVGDPIDVLELVGRFDPGEQQVRDATDTMMAELTTLVDGLADGEATSVEPGPTAVDLTVLNRR